MAELYRPSNGTEGEIFQGFWCARCRRDIKGNCRILILAMALDVDSPDYPREWTFADDGSPVCTAFIDRSTPRRGFHCRKTNDLFDGSNGGGEDA